MTAISKHINRQKHNTAQTEFNKFALKTFDSFDQRSLGISNKNNVDTTNVACLSKKGSLYSITERRVPGLIPVLGSQLAGDVSHKPGGMLPLLSARPAVIPATLKRAATNFAAW